jgi:hypothetical protein
VAEAALAGLSVAKQADGLCLAHCRAELGQRDLGDLSDDIETKAGAEYRGGRQHLAGRIGQLRQPGAHHRADRGGHDPTQTTEVGPWHLQRPKQLADQQGVALGTRGDCPHRAGRWLAGHSLRHQLCNIRLAERAQPETFAEPVQGPPGLALSEPIAFTVARGGQHDDRYGPQRRRHLDQQLQ